MTLSAQEKRLREISKERSNKDKSTFIVEPSDFREELNKNQDFVDTFADLIEDHSSPEQDIFSKIKRKIPKIKELI